MLSDKFNLALRSVRDVSSNPYLVHMSNALRVVESAGAGEPLGLDAQHKARSGEVAAD